MNIFNLLPNYIQACAIIIGGVWAYWKFIYQRQQEPATEIDIDVSSIHKSFYRVKSIISL